MQLIPKKEATEKWCHEAIFLKYFDEKDRCAICRGDKRRELADAEEYCAVCRLPCGKDGCTPETGPCCTYCLEFI
jgi:hypothetical protein